MSIPTPKLKEHEKFWAFIFLVIAILGLAITAISLSSDSDNPAMDIVFAAKLRILDIAIGGMLTIAGMCAQALFRISATDKINAETARQVVQQQIDDKPQAVKVVNPASDPAHVTTTNDDDGALPESEQIK